MRSFLFVPGDSLRKFENAKKTAADSSKLTGDSAGVPIVVISNDGAAAVTQRIAMTKIQAAMKYHMTSGEVAEKAKTDTALAAEIKANPLIETARQGAVPITMLTCPGPRKPSSVSSGESRIALIVAMIVM